MQLANCWWRQHSFRHSIGAGSNMQKLCNVNTYLKLFQCLQLIPPQNLPPWLQQAAPVRTAVCSTVLPTQLGIGG